MPRCAFYGLFIVSGFAGLIYESIWAQYLKLFLGHAAYAQSLVLAVFMGGMAVGAAAAGRFSERLVNPLLVYARVEAMIGLLALAFHSWFVALTDWSYAWLLPSLGNEALVLAGKLGVSCLLILPQSVLLGMTFPLMSAGLARAQPRAPGESIAMLYFTNSLGAAAGVLASGFVLIAWAGLPGTLRTAGSLNLLIAATVWLLAQPAHHAPLRSARSGAGGAGPVLAVAFFTGLASFVYEIGWIRMLSLVLGASTHSFELMLSTFILGLALGGLAVRRRVDASPAPERLLGWVQIAMGLLALATLPVYDFTFSLMEALMKGLARSSTGYLLFNASGQAIAALVMLPATFCAGMTLPLLTGALLRRGAGEAAIGKVYAANTLGAIAGVVLAVHVGLPLLGLKGTLLLGSLIDAALGLALLRVFEVGKRVAFATVACAVLFLAAVLAVRLDANKMTAGVFRHGELAASRDARILFNKDGKTATVHLVKYPEATSLRTNGKSDGSINLDRAGVRGTDEITMVLTAALPLALKPELKSAAVIGIGTGLTTHTLLQSLGIERVDTVEIEAAMAEASRGFMPRNSGAFADPRGSIVIDDAKTFFAAHDRRYDLIVSEPSNPWVSGVSSLFTREFYRRIRTHLEPGGLLAQWVDLNAARQRFMEKSAADVVALLNAQVPLLELLEPSRSRRPINPLFQGAYAFERVENTRLAWYARNFLVSPRAPQPEAVPTPLQKDLELIKLRLLECRAPREHDVWLHSALRVATAMNPYLAPDDAAVVWKEIAAGRCFASLQEFQRRWIALFGAVALRDAARMGELGESLLATQTELRSEAREYLLMAAMAGSIAARKKPRALELWSEHAAQLSRVASSPAFRLLRCHAEPAGGEACAAAFRTYAER